MTRSHLCSGSMKTVLWLNCCSTMFPRWHHCGSLAALRRLLVTLRWLLGEFTTTQPLYNCFVTAPPLQLYTISTNVSLLSPGCFTYFSTVQDPRFCRASQQFSNKILETMRKYFHDCFILPYFQHSHITESYI